MIRFLLLSIVLVSSLASTAAYAVSTNVRQPEDGAVYDAGSTVYVSSFAMAAMDGHYLMSHALLKDGVTIARKSIPGEKYHTLSKSVGPLASGTYKFASVATDHRGQAATSKVVTIIVNDAPTVRLTAPANGASYAAPARITLTATASDSDGHITKVEFYNGGTRLYTDTTAPYSYTWTGVPGSASQYALRARAHDNRGRTTYSAVHKVTVNAAPSVTVGRTPNWASIIAPATVTLSASASDSDGTISKVEFYNGSTRVATDTSAPYSHQVSDLAAGNYSFRAKAYDNRGAVTTSAANALEVQPRGNSPGIAVRRYVYDAHQRLCKTIEPETGATVVEYDAAGNVLWTASGQPYLSATNCQRDSVPVAERVVRQYDSRNRVQSVDYPDNRGNLGYTYTPDGLPQTVAASAPDGLVTTTYAYNQRRLLTQETLDWNNIRWGIGYGYTGNGHLASLHYPSGLVVSYAPNALGQSTRAGSFATGVSYWPNGAIKQFTYGNGIVHTLSQNARGLPERSRDASGSTAVHDDSYDYDFNGNVAAISDGLPAGVGHRTMTYDGLDRLTRVISPMFGGDNTAIFEYDAIDNLLYARVGNKREVSYWYNDANQLTNVRSPSGATVAGLGYDVYGNVANKNGKIFDFDYGNRLRSISGTASYVYDGQGRRVRDVTGGSKYSLYSKAGQLLYANDHRRALETDYIYLGGSLVAMREQPHGSSAVTVKYQHTDALGSPVVVTDGAAQVLERDRYGPYGTQVGSAANDGPGYTGHVMDAASGLTYMQQRYYDPGLGRFLSVDPVTVYASTGANFNRFWYANNNPYRFTDPDGRQVRPNTSSRVGAQSQSGAYNNEGGNAGMNSAPPLLQSTVERAGDELKRVADAFTSPELGDLRDASVRLCGGTRGSASCVRAGFEDGHPAIDMVAGLGAARGLSVELVTDWPTRSGVHAPRGWAGLEFQVGVRYLGIGSGYHARGLMTTEGAYVSEGLNPFLWKPGSSLSATGNAIVGVHLGGVFPSQWIPAEDSE